MSYPSRGALNSTVKQVLTGAECVAAMHHAVNIESQNGHYGSIRQRNAVAIYFILFKLISACQGVHGPLCWSQMAILSLALGTPV